MTTEVISPLQNSGKAWLQYLPANYQRENQQDADHLAGQGDGNCQNHHENDGQGG